MDLATVCLVLHCGLRGRERAVKYLHKTAEISPCGTYRFGLSRVWDLTKPACTFIALNPSKADADVDDPTIRRCVGFADDWGCGTLHMVNLYPYRATFPDQLVTDLPKDVMAKNDSAITAAMLFSKYCIGAWGTHRKVGTRGKELVEKYRSVLSYLELTKGGDPRHPLYLPGHLRPIPYDNEL